MSWRGRSDGVQNENIMILSELHSQGCVYVRKMFVHHRWNITGTANYSATVYETPRLSRHLFPSSGDKGNITAHFQSSRSCVLLDGAVD